MISLRLCRCEKLCIIIEFSKDFMILDDFSPVYIPFATFDDLSYIVD